jgi:uncharacterized protein
LTSQPPPGIARIINQKGSAVGGGALLGGGLVVLTCAHVVNAALGLRPDAPDAPFSHPVQVDFPLHGTEPVPANIVAWSPPGALGAGDVAILRLETRPNGVPPMTLVTRVPARDEDLATFGYPRGRPTGIWKRDLAHAGPLVGGWSQLIGTNSQGYKLQPGFSGCPIMDASSEVLGMVAQADRDVTVDAAAYIPVGIIAATLKAHGEGSVLPLTEPSQDLAIMDATTVFIGRTRRGPVEGVLIKSWADYVEAFGEPVAPKESFLGIAVRGFFENGGDTAYIVRVLTPDSARALVEIPTSDPAQQLIATAKDFGPWGNDISVTVKPGSRTGFRLLVSGSSDQPAQEIRLNENSQSIVEEYDNLAFDNNGPNPVLQRVISHSIDINWRNPSHQPASPQHGVWRLSGGSDGRVTARDYIGSAEQRHGIGALRSLEDIGLACVPDADHPRLIENDRRTLIQALISACEEVRCIAILGYPPNAHEIQQVHAPSDSRAAAVFIPAIHVPWRDEASGATVTPVGHVAGAIARNDLTHGVHVAPLGLDLRGLSPSSATSGGIDYHIGDVEADLLLRQGVNPLRINTKGVVVLANAQSTAIGETWRPLQTVRTMFMIERTLSTGLAWTRFSPNTEETWVEIRAQVQGYLTRLWRRGVLLGESAEKAFSVECNVGTVTVTATLNSATTVKASVPVTFGGAVPRTLTITPTNPLMAVGNNLQLAATITMSDGTTVSTTATSTWASSTAAVAAVSTEGLIHAVAAGTVVISATYKDPNVPLPVTCWTMITVVSGPPT